MKGTLTADKLEAFQGGFSADAYTFMGCGLDEKNGKAVFRVWAPRAKYVSVVGDFNGWDCKAAPMKKISDNGVFETEVAGVKKFDGYKFYISSGGEGIYKSDPYAFHSETHDGTASKAFDISRFVWSDSSYMQARDKKNIYSSPISIYECHIGSWKKHTDGNYFSYRDFAGEIVPYLLEMGYTHLELMGVAEYPFDGSWGYQVTAYYAPTSRYGTPEDFMYLVDKLHSAGIGVILDWVPGHFPKNGNALYEFDGGPLYEPADELRNEHKEWGTRCFDYARGEVSSFLISNAMMWLKAYHVDGLRVDAVASMLYLDYGRTEWRPNRFGGHENLDAVEFFKKLNTTVFSEFPSAMMIAEESTAWPLVTHPVSKGGLGFNFKWNMGWMNDTLKYAKTDPFFRSYNHHDVTFSMSYAFSENYILPISHDEVVHGKGSLLNKMPGRYEEKFAGWRNYLMNMFGHPGKKLLFMGSEFAQFDEWNYAKELDWMLLGYEAHRSAKEFTKILNRIYKEYPALYAIENDWSGYQWYVADDYKQNVLVYERRAGKNKRVLVIINFAGAEWKNYTFGCEKGTYTELLASDISGYSVESGKTYTAKDKPSHGFDYSLTIDIPPLSGIYLTAPAIKENNPKTAASAAASPALKKTRAAGVSSKKAVSEKAGKTVSRK